VNQITKVAEELPRRPLPRTRVNKGKKKGQSASGELRPVQGAIKLTGSFRSYLGTAMAAGGAATLG
jgi:hypothetical protein